MLLELCADDDATNNAHSVLSARRCFDFAQHDILADSVGSDTIRCHSEGAERPWESLIICGGDCHVGHNPFRF